MSKAFNKFQPFVRGLINGDHDFGADTIRIGFASTGVANTDEDYGDITWCDTEWVRGGVASMVLTVSKATQAAGIALVEVNDLVITASGTASPFQQVVVYNTNSADPASALIGWYDYGSVVSLATDETLTLDFTPASGLLTVE